VIFVDTNILVRSAYPPDSQYAVTKNALATLRKRQETLCIAPQNLVEFWSVVTRSPKANGLGMDLTTADQELATIQRLFHLLPYTPQVLATWRRSLSRRVLLAGKRMTRTSWR
jgi:predicted nucleic acid-binding protein